MRELPVGAVTMRFGDIKGSTALLHRLGGDRYGEALSAQRALLRSTFSAGGGHEMKQKGTGRRFCR